MQSARGTLLLKLCRDQRLQSNRIFFQTFIMPTPIMYYKSLPSHSASWSHQYSTACFSFPRNKLIYIKKKNADWVYCSEKWVSGNGVSGCGVNSHTGLWSFLPTSCCWRLHLSPCYCSILYYSALFHPFPSALSKHLNSKPNSKPAEA